MRKILFLLCFIPAFVSAQYDSTKPRQTITSYGFDWKNGKFGTLIIPTDTLKMAVKDSNSIASIGGKIYRYNGYYWENTVNVSLPIYVDTLFRQNDSLVYKKNGVEYNLGALNGVDSIWMVDGGSDPDTLRYRFLGANYTVGIITGGGGSSSWGFITGTLSSQTDLQAALNLKLNISDTAAMLLGYLRLSDTAAMLNPYLRKSDTTNKWIGIGWLTTLAGKQDALISGTNIKTVAGNSLVGSGNVTVDQILPSQTGASGKVLKSDGTTATWQTPTGVNIDSTAARLRRGTVAHRLAIATPDTGQVFFQTDELEGVYTYDGLRWIWSPPANSILNDFDKFTTTTINFSGGSSGAGASQTQQFGLATDNIASGVLINTTGSTSSGSAYQTYPATRDSSYNKSFISYTRLKFSALSNATDEYRILIGPADNIFSANLNAGSAVFYYRRDTYGANWQVVVTCGAIVDTGVPVVANQYIDLVMNYDEPSSTFKAYINGVLVSTQTCTMPNLTLHANQFYFQKSAGTTSTTLTVDKMYIVNKVN